MRPPAGRNPALALAVCLTVSGAAACVAAPTTHTVTIDGTNFRPSTLTVRSGDTIVWVNKDPFPHTVTSASGSFDSNVLQADASWKLVATSRGEFKYICSLHPTMTGSFTVD